MTLEDVMDGTTQHDVGHHRLKLTEKQGETVSRSEASTVPTTNGTVAPNNEKYTQERRCSSPPASVQLKSGNGDSDCYTTSGNSQSGFSRIWESSFNSRLPVELPITSVEQPILSVEQSISPSVSADVPSPSVSAGTIPTTEILPAGRTMQYENAALISCSELVTGVVGERTGGKMVFPSGGVPALVCGRNRALETGFSCRDGLDKRQKNATIPKCGNSAQGCSFDSKSPLPSSQVNQVCPILDKLFGCNPVGGPSEKESETEVQRHGTESLEKSQLLSVKSEELELTGKTVCDSEVSRLQSSSGKRGEVLTGGGKFLTSLSPDGKSPDAPPIEKSLSMLNESRTGEKSPNKSQLFEKSLQSSTVENLMDKSQSPTVDKSQDKLLLSSVEKSLSVEKSVDWTNNMPNEGDGNGNQSKMKRPGDKHESNRHATSSHRHEDSSLKPKDRHKSGSSKIDQGDRPRITNSASNRTENSKDLKVLEMLSNSKHVSDRRLTSNNSGDKHTCGSGEGFKFTQVKTKERIPKKQDTDVKLGSEPSIKGAKPIDNHLLKKTFEKNVPMAKLILVDHRRDNKMVAIEHTKSVAGKTSLQTGEKMQKAHHSSKSVAGTTKPESVHSKPGVKNLSREEDLPKNAERQPLCSEFEYVLRGQKRKRVSSKGEDLRFRRLIHVEESANGGATVVHSYQDEIASLPPDQLAEFVREYFRVVFEEESEGVAKHVMGIVHRSALYLPDLLEYFADNYGDMIIKRGVLGRSDIETTSMAEFRRAVHATYSVGTYRCGGLLQLSLVGTKAEESGGFFPEFLDRIERNAFLRAVMPWGEMSKLQGIEPNLSNDGPILWSRPGEQVVPTADMPKSPLAKKRLVDG